MDGGVGNGLEEPGRGGVEEPGRGGVDGAVASKSSSCSSGVEGAPEKGGKVVHRGRCEFFVKSKENLGKIIQWKR